MSPKVTPLLNKLFNIRPAEWPRLALLFLMYLVVLTGINWGEPIVEAAFLEQVGVQFLPWAFVVNAAFSILSIAIYTAFADRVDNTILLLVILGLSMVGVIIGLALLGRGLVTLTYPLLYFVLNVPLLDIFNVHWATYVNGFYDTQSAKRIIPVLASGARISGIVAGLTLPLLNRYLTPGGIILIWLGSLAVTALLAWLMPALLKDEAVPAGQISPDQLVGDSRRSASYLDNVREGFRFVSQSPFLRWLAVSTLLIFILFPLLNYQALQIFQAKLQTTANISNFIAMLNGLGNLIALPIQLFLLNRLIGRIGLGNASLIFPLGTLAVSGALVASQNLLTGALAYVNRTTFRTTFRNPIDSLLYNAVPLRLKGRARAFIGGLVVPIGALIGGALLLIPVIPTTWLLGAIIAILAVAYPVSAWITRRQYSQALITMLEQEDFSFLFAHITSSTVVADPTALKLLQQKLRESTTDEFTLFMAQLISQIGGSEAVSILAETAKTSPAGGLRAAILDTLTAAEVGGTAARRLYLDFLSDPDSRVRQSALTGLERLAGPKEPDFQALALSMLSDPDLGVRVQVLSALAGRDDFYELTPAVDELNRLLADPDPQHRARGVRVLGLVGNAPAMHSLSQFLADPEDEVRLEATVAVEKLAQNGLPEPASQAIWLQLPPLLQDPVERIRQTTIHILARPGQPELYQAIMTTLTDPSSQVRSTAVDALVQAGKLIIPLIHPLLDSPDSQLRKMAAVILSRINPREFGDLNKSNIMGNLLTIYQNFNLSESLAGYANFASIKVLQSVLREQNQALLDEIFYLLAAVHELDDIKIIAESLSSDNLRTRANASEALEALTTPQTAQLIAPLLEPNLNPDQLLALSRETWEMQPPDPAKTIRQLNTTLEKPLLRAIMALALGEMAAMLKTNAPPTGSPVRPGDDDPVADADAAPKSGSRRSGPLDPLAALGDSTAQEQPAPRPRRRPPPDLLGALFDRDEAAKPPPPDPAISTAKPVDSLQIPLTLPEIEELLTAAAADPVEDVSNAARAAQRKLTGFNILQAAEKEANVLSTIERVIFLKEVPFFQGMTINQLQVLAAICEEEFFEEDQQIFKQGDAGGALYVIVSGKVGIEQEKRSGSFARLATLGSHSYFGEMTLFDNAPRSAAAVAVQDTLTLKIRREPLIALARQYPDLSLELINVLSERLRQANNRIAELTKTRPRELQKLYDTLD